jgi:hypothetical protein
MDLETNIQKELEAMRLLKTSILAFYTGIDKMNRYFVLYCANYNSSPKCQMITGHIEKLRMFASRLAVCKIQVDEVKGK